MEIGINKSTGDLVNAELVGVQKSSVEQDLIKKVSPVVESLGFSLRDLSIVEGNRSTLRVTIDGVALDQSIGIEDCARVHESLGPMFDVWNPIDEAYTLEISSPGEKAPLRLMKHFEAVVGEEIEFRTVDFIEIEGGKAKPRKNWKGLLVATGERHLEIEDYLGRHSILIEQIRTARCLRDWNNKKN